MKILNILTAIAMLASAALTVQAADDNTGRENNKRNFIEDDEDLSFLDEKVIVRGDTVSIIIPERNYGRYDRGLYNFLFAPKGEWAFGLTANYGNFNTKDVQMLNVLENLDFDGTIYSVKPSVSYFFRNNQSVGVKFNFTKGEARVDNMSVDFDEDLNFDIHGVKYYQRTVSGGIFYRNYVGLGRDKRFAVFNEVDLSFGGGKSEFLRSYNDVPKQTNTDIFQASINFSPGLCVFIMDHVSFNISFGVFGVNFRNEKQTTDGVDEGSRFYSNANFKFNIFNINFGLGVHI